MRRAEAVEVDVTGKLPGRGAYLHDKRSCWERGIRGSLAQALKVELTTRDRETLLAFMAELPSDVPVQEEGNVE